MKRRRAASSFSTEKAESAAPSVLSGRVTSLDRASSRVAKVVAARTQKAAARQIAPVTSTKRSASPVIRTTAKTATAADDTDPASPVAVPRRVRPTVLPRMSL